MKRAIAPKHKEISIVGIGASAGGLNALKIFFKETPADSGMAYVVVTHRDPSSTSLLPDILSKCTSMPVAEVKDGTRIKPNHVYIAPSSHYLRLDQGTLIYGKAVIKDGLSLPIDYFFRALAEDQKEKAICIVLSGTGSDGTLGVRAVSGEGGMVMAQDVKTAQFSDMPNSAIATGMIDYVLAPDKMPQQLITYESKLQPGTKAKNKIEADPLPPEALDDILSLLRQHTGSDFASYKMNTLKRRIERRMNVHHINHASHYLRYLTENPHEINLLFNELLIGVTSFFRDPGTFDALAKDILPELLKDKKYGDSVRIWITGCSTGEEAYTLAILMQEYMEKSKKQLSVQIFATDLDEKAINRARSGYYADGIALDVMPSRLGKYFTHEDNRYRVKKNIREMVIFAAQNLIQDPPFTKIDLISCRNLLIYLDTPMQKKVIPMFHYALRPDGILLLGSSETIGTFGDMFTPVNSRLKIFRRKETPISGNRLPRLMEFPRLDTSYLARVQTARGKNSDISELAQRLLLKQYIPPSLIVNDKGDIFFIHGRTGLYLEPPSGPSQATHNALNMAREGLQMPLTAIIRKAFSEEKPVVHKGIKVRSNGHYSRVDLRAQKITEPEALRGLIWIAFEEAGQEKALPVQKGKPAKKSRPVEVDHDGPERELQFIKQSLQNTIEELEASNEELKSTNEELQSTNEELQSSNEELETSKEEMQSLNEELQTVNVELESKINDLAHANDDMKNLLNSTGIATLFLDNALNISRFTNQAKKVIHLIPGDIGRQISDIAMELEYDTLVEDATEVMQTLIPKEIEVRARDWSWYMMRIMPYRTAENTIDGLVITFVDITKLKKSDILLALHTMALEMVSKNAPVNDILNNLLRAIEGQTQGIWCSISVYDEKKQQLHHAAAPSLPEPFNKLFDGISVNAAAKEPCAMAVYQRKQITLFDISNDIDQTRFHTLALNYNLKACWAQPIYAADRTILGAFSIYYHQAHKPSPVEEDLINQTILLMGTALSRPIAELKP
jgi:two-component system CheB/CheR fusion protein